MECSKKAASTGKAEYTGKTLDIVRAHATSPGITSRPDSAVGFFPLDNSLPSSVAAALGGYLVLDHDAGHPHLPRGRGRAHEDPCEQQRAGRGPSNNRSRSRPACCHGNKRCAAETTLSRGCSSSLLTPTTYFRLTAGLCFSNAVADTTSLRNGSSEWLAGRQGRQAAFRPHFYHERIAGTTCLNTR